MTTDLLSTAFGLVLLGLMAFVVVGIPALISERFPRVPQGLIVVVWLTLLLVGAMTLGRATT